MYNVYRCENVSATYQFLGVAEDCCMLLAIPCIGFLYQQFLARCHPYIYDSLVMITWRPTTRKLIAKTWISPSKGTKLLLYRKDHVRSKLRLFHVKIIVCSCRSFEEEEEKKQKMEKIAVCPISVYNVSGVL